MCLPSTACQTTCCMVGYRCRSTCVFCTCGSGGEDGDSRQNREPPFPSSSQRLSAEGRNREGGCVSAEELSINQVMFMSKETIGPRPLSRRQALILLAGVPPLALGLASDSPRVSPGGRRATMIRLALLSFWHVHAPIPRPPSRRSGTKRRSAAVPRHMR